MKKQTFLILFLCTIVFIGVISFLDKAPTYIGQKGINSNIIHELEDEYLHYVYRTKVQQFSAEDLLKLSPVTDEEIELYRTYLGTMQEQIDSIKEQYEDPTEEEKVIRDKKIADIRANFEDDDYVREKIKKLKQQAITDYLQEQSEQTGGEKAEHFNYVVEIEGQQPIKKMSTNHVIRTRSQSFNHEFDSINLSLDDNTSIHFTVPLEYKAAKVSVSLLDTIYNDNNYGDEIENFEWRKMAFYMLWLSTIIAIIYLIFNRKQLVDTVRNHFYITFNKMSPYFDLNIVIVCFLVYLSVQVAIGLGHSVENMIYNIYYGHSLIILLSKMLEILFMMAVIAATWIGASLLLQQYRKGNNEYLAVKYYSFAKEAFYNRRVGTQMLLFLTVFACAGFGFAISCVQPVAFALYIPLFIIVVLPALFLFLRRYSYLNKIIKHTEKLANGEITEPLKVRGDQTFAKHAANLNALQQGVKTSVQAQAKSERLKTELISNVSHDLRTPLTSIITYTDLLKNPDLSADERQQYVGVLEKKSARLKQLIEDLFEVSKMASGNVEIMRQQIDLAQLLQQIVAEHEEDFEQANLALRMTITEQPNMKQVDPQKLWRVFDNLLQNARKYSLENTRVYVSLAKQGDNAVFVIRNVTKYELGENPDELAERFKRGDASRNTEGSGLGLAIAQSIVDLHGGTMKIELLGDLFQVTVVLP